MTLEFTSAAAFKWRLNTGPYSSAVDVDAGEPVTLGATGVNVTFSAASGWIAGTRFLVPLRTHIPHVRDVTTAHGGSKSASHISQPVAAAARCANMPNQGSTLSDVLPMKGNRGSHAIHAYPAAGSLSGGGSAVPAVGYANQGGVGLSNIINAVPTHGYLAANYPTAYLRIVGAAAVGAVSGVLSGELTVSGTYTGTSSYVYQLEPHGTTSQFRWRKYALGGTEADAGAWTNANAVVTGSSSTTIDAGLSATFASSSYAIGAVNRWTFTANKGHTFVYRDSGRALWSEEVVITGGVQPLSSGISVRFAQVSGYAPGDQFAVRNRTVDSFGTYTGADDATFELEVLDPTLAFDPPVFHRQREHHRRAAGGHDRHRHVRRPEHRPRVRVQDCHRAGELSVDVQVAQVPARAKRRRGPVRLGGAPREPLPDAPGRRHVRAVGGHLRAHRGRPLDGHRARATFRWRKDGGDWSETQSMTSVGGWSATFQTSGRRRR